MSGTSTREVLAYSAFHPQHLMGNHCRDQNAVPPKTLSDLPHEILSHIIWYMTPPQAASLARVSKVFVRSAETQIWGSLQLATGEWRSWENVAKEDGGKAEERQTRASLRTKMRSIILRGDERRFALVREMSCSPRVGNMPETLLLLGFASPSLRSLVISGDPNHQYSADHFWRPVDENCFDIRLLEANIRFSSLTHLTLADAPLRFFGTLPLLCNSAPLLHTLLADLSQEPVDWGDDDDHPRPVYERNTRLQVLGIKLEGVWTSYEDGHSADTIVHLLERSPHLREAYLHHMGSEIGRRRIMEKLQTLQHLQDLAFIISPEQFQTALDQAEPLDSPIFPQLRRLMLLGDTEKMIAYELIPPFPDLEVLLFYCYDYCFLEAVADPEIPQPKANPLLPEFCARIGRAPRLREIRHTGSEGWGDYPVEYSSFDELVTGSDLVCAINSFQGGSRELVTARILENRYELADELVDQATVSEPYAWSQHRYTAEDGTERMKRFFEVDADCQKAVWRDYNRYGGGVVPLEVLERMQEVHGASDEEWTGRGVKVGDAAWKVLTAWGDSL